MKNILIIDDDIHIGNLIEEARILGLPSFDGLFDILKRRCASKRVRNNAYGENRVDALPRVREQNSQSRQSLIVDKHDDLK